jgi:DNA-directed RNA polymerase specialized sigma24 family protein
MDSSVSPRWETPLVAYLSGTGDLTELYCAAKQPLKRIVARLAPSMPEDLREDAVQQLFVRLLENPPNYDPDRCSMPRLIYGLLRNSVKQVRAMFAPPGQRTRISKRGSCEEVQPQCKQIGTKGIVVDGRVNTVRVFESREAAINRQRATAAGPDAGEIAAETIEECMQETDDLASAIDLAHSTRWTAEATMAAAEANELLGCLPAHVANATWLVVAGGYTITEAATALGISRFAAARAIKSVIRDRAAAGADLRASALAL